MFSRDLLAYTLFFLSLLQLGFVSARPQFQQYAKREAALPVALEPRTNGARMALGYQPMAPRSLFKPSRVVAREGQASPVPYAGKIRQFSNYNLSPGFVGNQYHGGHGRIRVVQNSDLLSVSFSLSPSSSGPVNLAITNAGTAWPFLGIAGGALSPTTFTDINWLVGTNPTTLNAPPTDVGNSANFTLNKGNSESMIWYYNTATKEITASWINSGGGAVSVYFFYVASGPNEGVYTAGTTSIASGGELARLYLV